MTLQYVLAYIAFASFYFIAFDNWINIHDKLMELGYNETFVYVLFAVFWPVLLFDDMVRAPDQSI